MRKGAQFPQAHPLARPSLGLDSHLLLPNLTPLPGGENIWPVNFAKTDQKTELSPHKNAHSTCLPFLALADKNEAPGLGNYLS